MSENYRKESSRDRRVVLGSLPLLSGSATIGIDSSGMSDIF